MLGSRPLHASAREPRFFKAHGPFLSLEPLSTVNLNSVSPGTYDRFEAKLAGTRTFRSSVTIFLLQFWGIIPLNTDGFFHKTDQHATLECIPEEYTNALALSINPKLRPHERDSGLEDFIYKEGSVWGESERNVFVVEEQTGTFCVKFQTIHQTCLAIVSTFLRCFHIVCLAVYIILIIVVLYLSLKGHIHYSYVTSGEIPYHFLSTLSAGIGYCLMWGLTYQHLVPQEIHKLRHTVLFDPPAYIFVTAIVVFVFDFAIHIQTFLTEPSDGALVVIKSFDLVNVICALPYPITALFLGCLAVYYRTEFEKLEKSRVTKNGSLVGEIRQLIHVYDKETILTTYLLSAINAQTVFETIFRAFDLSRHWSTMDGSKFMDLFHVLLVILLILEIDIAFASVDEAKKRCVRAFVKTQREDAKEMKLFEILDLPTVFGWQVSYGVIGQTLYAVGMVTYAIANYNLNHSKHVKFP